MSFTEWTIVGSPKFVGLANFQDMLTDQRFLTALKNTVFFVAVTVPALIVLSLLIAVFLAAYFTCLQYDLRRRSSMEVVVTRPLSLRGQRHCYLSDHL